MPSDLHGWHRQVSGTQAPSELGSRSHPLTLPPEGKHPDQASLSQAAACTHCPPAPAVCGFHPKEDDVLRLRPLSPCLVSLLCAGGPAPSAPFHVSAWVIPAVPTVPGRQSWQRGMLAHPPDTRVSRSPGCRWSELAGGEALDCGFP